MYKMRRFLSIILLLTIICTTIINNNSVSYADNTSDIEELNISPEQEKEVQKHEVTENDRTYPVEREKTELIIQYKDDVSPTKKSAALSNVRSKLNVKKLQGKRKIGKYEIIEIDKTDDINIIAEALKNEPDIKNAQPNYKLDLMNTPQDEYFSTQWAISNIGQDIEGQEGIAGQDINIIPVWDKSKGSASVIIGVLDTGIDIMHEDLAKNIYKNPNEIANDNIDNDNNGYIDDIYGWDFYNNDNTVVDLALENHGTHIAGIIASDDNSTGIVGVVPDCKILPVKFISGNCGYTSDAIEGIEYAKQMGAKIINCSWGGYQYNYALKDAIENSDMLFVCASGNNGLKTCVYPAAFNLPNVISVGAVDNRGTIAGFSNYGDTVDVFAPGVNIKSTLPVNGHGYISGTSMAAPFVAGLSAILKSYNNTLSSSQLKSIILNNSNEINSLSNYKTINSLKAFEYLADVEKVETPDLNENSNNQEIMKKKKVSFEEIYPENILEIIQNKNSYSMLTEGEKSSIAKYFNIEKGILSECFIKNYTLLESINIAGLISKYQFSVDEITNLLKIYNAIQKVNIVLKKYFTFIEKNDLIKEDAKEIRNLLLSGYQIELIASLYANAKALGASISDITGKNKKFDINKYKNKYPEEEFQKYSDIAESVNMDLAWVLNYAEENALNFEQLMAKFRNLPFPTNIINDDSLKILSGTIDYNRYFNAPFSYRNNQSENVSLNSGSLNYSSTDLALAGRNGLDLNITLQYKSDHAQIYKADIGYNTVTDYDYDYDVYGGAEAYWHNWIGTGDWDYYDVPLHYIGWCENYSDAIAQAEDYANNDEYYPGFYEPDGTDLEIDYYAYIDEYLDYCYEYDEPYDTISINTYTELHNNLGAGWSLGFSSIEYDNGWNIHLSDGSVYKYQYTSITDDSNLKDYSLKDLRLEPDSGSYSNGVVNSSYVLYHADGKKEYFSSDGRLIGIKDRFDNTIKFEHIAINGHYLISKITDTLNRVINILYENTATGKKVSIKIPDDSRKIEYYLEPIAGCTTSDYELVKKVDQEGRETTYNYSIQSGNFSFLNKSYRSTTNKFALLNEINYPTGAFSYYTYESVVGNLGNQGTEVYYRVKTRKDCEGASEYNLTTYNYSANDYTGYPAYSDPQNLSAGFTYVISITDNENNITEYTFNNNHMKIKEEVKENLTTIKSGLDITYNSNKLPTEVKKKTYNGAIYLETIENYQYDDFAKVIASWDSQANGNIADTEHKTIYTYNPVYHYLTSKEYKKDAVTTIKEEFTPSTDNKMVTWAEVKENNVLKKKSWFNYDSFGNVTELRSYLDDWTMYLSTFYSYTDNDPARNDQFNGGYLTRKWATGVKDTDGVNVVAKSGNTAGTIDEIYKYDFYGNRIVSIDGVGNITNYQYDKIGRLIQLTNSDNTYKSWVYTDETNLLTYTNENLKQFQYIYDGFGNLKYERDVQSGENLNSYMYDSKFRLNTESNQNTSPSYRIITYSYYSDNRIRDKVTKNQDNNIISKESFVYDDANSNGMYSKTTKTVTGDSNSPSISTVSYINKHSLVEKQGRIHNGAELLDTYKYNYLGNKVEEKSARAYQEGWSQAWTAKYEYDYAGKLIKTYDINNNCTTNTYDTLGRLVSATDPKGNIASPKYSSTYLYDALNRLIEEKHPFVNISGTISYTVKRNYYDRNGNLTLQKTSSNKQGETQSFNQTGYEYNNRNMLFKVTTYNGTTPENYTQYYYDAVGNKLRQYAGLSSPLTINGLDNIVAGSDNSYSTTKYDYDRFGRLTKMTDPMGKYEINTYDTNGNLTGKTDRNGSTFANVYDGLGRLTSTSVVTPDGTGNIMIPEIWTDKQAEIS